MNTEHFSVDGNVDAPSYTGTWAGNTIGAGYLDLSGVVPTSRTINGYSLSGNVNLNNIAVGVSNWGGGGPAYSGYLYPHALTINGVTYYVLCTTR